MYCTWLLHVCPSLFWHLSLFAAMCRKSLSFFKLCWCGLDFSFWAMKKNMESNQTRVVMHIRLLVLKGKGKWIHAYRSRTSMLPFFSELCIWFRSFLDLLFVTSCPYYVRLSWAFVNFLSLIIDHTLIS